MLVSSHDRVHRILILAVILHISGHQVVRSADSDSGEQSVKLNGHSSQCYPLI